MLNVDILLQHDFVVIMKFDTLSREPHNKPFGVLALPVCLLCLFEYFLLFNPIILIFI